MLHTDSLNAAVPIKPRIKIKDPEILDSDIWNGDIFDRSKCAKVFKELICEETEPLVVAVNGKWGTGKTFFLQRFLKEYQCGENAGLGVYLNSWENDYLSNPLLYVFSGVEEALTSKTDIEFIEKASWDICRKSISQIGWNLIRKLSLGLSEGLDKIADQYPSNIYQSQIMRVNQVKDTLKKLADTVRAKTGRPLLICIDELDRCRPSYAIEMLERIKHFFNIPNMVFILGIDREQLSKSIKSTYGDIDTENYLHRFIDVEFVLPETDCNTFIKSCWDQYKVAKYLEKMDAEHGTQISLTEGNNFKQIFKLCAQIHRLTLRELQTALKWFVVIVRRLEPRNYSFPIFIAILVLLRLRKRSLYAKFLTGNTTPTEVIDYILPVGSERLYNDDPWAYSMIVAAIYASFGGVREDNVHLNQLKAFVQKGGPAERGNQIPAVLIKLGASFQQEIVSKIDSMPKSHGFEPVYSAQTLKLVRDRLDSFL